jgi:hypothetical protein
MGYERGKAVIEREEALTEEGQARRRFLKQAGTVAWASPFIVTMMSRAAHAQAPCGVQALDAGLPPAIFCDTTGGTPCGTAVPCIPDPANPGPGQPCICAT